MTKNPWNNSNARLQRFYRHRSYAKTIRLSSKFPEQLNLLQFLRVATLIFGENKIDYLCPDGFNLEILPGGFVMQRPILINAIIFFAYVLDSPLNMQMPHYCPQCAGKRSLILARDSLPIYCTPTYIRVPLLWPHRRLICLWGRVSLLN